MTKAKLIFIFLFAAALPVLAADAPASKKRWTPMSSDPVVLGVLADQIASLGESTGDPLAYLLAAKIQKGLSILDSKATPGGDDTNPYPVFLKRAKALAGDNEHYLALINGLETLRTRSTLSGITQHRGALASGATLSFKITFKGGEDSAVALMLDPSHPSFQHRADIDMDLYVRDEDGRTICSMEGPGMPELCTWTPTNTAKFTAQVVNRGRIDAPFVLNFR